VVWEFYHPKFDEDGSRRIIYRMIHYPGELISKLVEKSGTGVQGTKKTD